MLGARSGFLELVKWKNSNVIGKYCFIHREALALRTMPQPLKQTLNFSIKVINCIKASALNTWLSKKLWLDMGAECESLLFYTLVHWLSKGNMLMRRVPLLPEVIEFLEIQHLKELKAVITDLSFQSRLAFLANMFCNLNELNCKLQGVQHTLEPAGTTRQDYCFYRKA